MERGVALLQLSRRGGGRRARTAQAGFDGFELLLTTPSCTAPRPSAGAAAPASARAATRHRRLTGLTPPRPRDLYNHRRHLELDRGTAGAEACDRPGRDHATPDESPDEQGDRRFAAARLAVARSRADAPAEIAAVRAAFETGPQHRPDAELDAPAPRALPVAIAAAKRAIA